LGNPKKLKCRDFNPGPFFTIPEFGIKDLVVAGSRDLSENIGFTAIKPTITRSVSYLLHDDFSLDLQ